MTCEACRTLMVEALYGELEAPRAGEFEAHVSGCASCAALFEELRATAARMSERRRPDPGDEYWNAYYERLEARMDRERSVVDAGRIAARRRSYVSWGYRVAAAVAVLAAGVWLGRSALAPHREAPVVATSRGAQDSVAAPGEDTSRVAESGAPARGAIDGSTTARDDRAGVRVASADARAREYIERSQVLLLALVNASPDSSAQGRVFTRQRERASALVHEASALRDDLPGGDNRRMRELVTDLQMILREIANLESRNDFDAVEIIRNRVDREGVLLKIDVEQMREDDGAPPVKRTGAID